MPENQLMRWDVINHFIEKNNYTFYLEIGYFKGYCFDNVRCRNKIAVDPNPSKNASQESMHEMQAMSKRLDFPKEFPVETIIKMTSDNYFSYRDSFFKDSEIDEGSKWDIIFIDGLHEAAQVERDIKNSLRYLSPNGVILLHDCNPPTYEHSTTGDKYGNWNGDCYKALLEFILKDSLGYYSVFTIDTDWGIGLIKPHKGDFQPFKRNYSMDYYRAPNDWDYFDKNRKELLNLISVDEFLAKF